MGGLFGWPIEAGAEELVEVVCVEIATDGDDL
jgi:hypothetical protein